MKTTLKHQKYQNIMNTIHDYELENNIIISDETFMDDLFKYLNSNENHIIIEQDKSIIYINYNKVKIFKK